MKGQNIVVMLNLVIIFGKCKQYVAQTGLGADKKFKYKNAGNS